ncbi:ATPase, T2SS/T4P/T4SS family [Pseudomonas viridiflava]|uniref:ATPase, T2SS/T4P/T4SS family n=1 Tax=Pseudomonas viridiflava TaxID=33069 RepID=UPI000F04E8BA|nr:ATPase, T2SS/T4P/T4SS family [Pseudomonas viridiflava]
MTEIMETEAHTVELHLHVLNDLLDAGFNELCINEPGQIWTYGRGAWKCIDMPILNYSWCEALSVLVANYSGQKPGPIMSAHLPGGERIEITNPPVTETPSITIRVPRKGKALTFDEIIEFGTFKNTNWIQNRAMTDAQRKDMNPELSSREHELLDLFHNKSLYEFFTKAVLYKKNIFFTGETGSGKTALLNALSCHIPLSERIIVVQDAKESRLPHPNQVDLRFTRDSTSDDRHQIKAVLASTLRQFPSRVLLQEIRGDEAYFFFQNVINSGHPGTMASWHANSTRLAIRRMANMIQASPEGKSLSQELIIKDLYMLSDILVQCDIGNDGKPCVREIYYDPEYALHIAG